MMMIDSCGLAENLDQTRATGMRPPRLLFLARQVRGNPALPPSARPTERAGRVNV
jgi:hypothetical protein